MARIFVLLFLILPQWALATVDLLYVTFPHYSVSLVLPLKAGELPDKALNAFTQAMFQSASLKAFLPDLSALGTPQFSQDLPTSKSILIAANDENDISRRPLRMNKITSALKNADKDQRASLAVMPVGASLRLTPPERREFHKKLKNRFNLLLALGGDDVHPSFYKEPITDSLDLNYARDFLEISLIRDFYRDGAENEPNNTIISGICRGCQITKVALEGETLGHSLYQDIIKEGLTEVRHDQGHEHEIELQNTEDHFFREALKGQSLMMLSYHHQAVRVQDGSLLQLAAVSHDQVPEAFLSKDKRIILMQFHPEESPTIDGPGQKIFEALLQRAFRKLSCSQLMR
jgi:putative glutamine amidotransferase